MPSPRPFRATANYLCKALLALIHPTTGKRNLRSSLSGRKIIVDSSPTDNNAAKQALRALAASGRCRRDTVCGLLVDAEGKVASEVAVGASAVMERAGARRSEKYELRSRGLKKGGRGYLLVAITRAENRIIPARPK